MPNIVFNIPSYWCRDIWFSSHLKIHMTLYILSGCSFSSLNVCFLHYMFVFFTACSFSSLHVRFLHCMFVFFTACSFSSLLFVFFTACLFSSLHVFFLHCMFIFFTRYEDRRINILTGWHLSSLGICYHCWKDEKTFLYLFY